MVNRLELISKRLASYCFQRVIMERRTVDERFCGFSKHIKLNALTMANCQVILYSIVHLYYLYTGK